MIRSRSLPPVPPARVEPGPDEDPVARAALVVLRAIVPDDDPHPPRDRVRLRPDPRILTDREAALRISATSAPIVCERHSAPDALELTIEPIPSDSPALIPHRWQVSEGYLYADAEREKMRATGNERVLLVGRGESIVLERQEFERFWVDFVLPSGHVVIPRSPEHFADYSGVAAIAREFGPFGGDDSVRVVSVD